MIWNSNFPYSVSLSNPATYCVAIAFPTCSGFFDSIKRGLILASFSFSKASSAVGRVYCSPSSISFFCTRSVKWRFTFCSSWYWNWPKAVPSPENWFSYFPATSWATSSGFFVSVRRVSIVSFSRSNTLCAVGVWFVFSSTAAISPFASCADA